MGIACGAQNLKDVERLSAEGSPSARRFLGVGARRVPDTTMRDFLCKLTPESLTPALHRLVKAAHRRKALASGDLPLECLHSTVKERLSLVAMTTTLNVKRRVSNHRS